MKKVIRSFLGIKKPKGSKKQAIDSTLAGSDNHGSSSGDGNMDGVLAEPSAGAGSGFPSHPRNTIEQQRPTADVQHGHQKHQRPRFQGLVDIVHNTCGGDALVPRLVQDIISSQRELIPDVTEVDTNQERVLMTPLKPRSQSELHKSRLLLQQHQMHRSTSFTPAVTNPTLLVDTMIQEGAGSVTTATAAVPEARPRHTDSDCRTDSCGLSEGVTAHPNFTAVVIKTQSQQQQHLQQHNRGSVLSDCNHPNCKDITLLASQQDAPHVYSQQDTFQANSQPQVTTSLSSKIPYVEMCLLSRQEDSKDGGGKAMEVQCKEYEGRGRGQWRSGQSILANAYPRTPVGVGQMSTTDHVPISERDMRPQQGHSTLSSSSSFLSSSSLSSLPTGRYRHRPTTSTLEVSASSPLPSPLSSLLSSSAPILQTYSSTVASATTATGSQKADKKKRDRATTYCVIKTGSSKDENRHKSGHGKSTSKAPSLTAFGSGNCGIGNNVCSVGYVPSSSSSSGSELGLDSGCNGREGESKTVSGGRLHHHRHSRNVTKNRDFIHATRLTDSREQVHDLCENERGMRHRHKSILKDLATPVPLSPAMRPSVDTYLDLEDIAAAAAARENELYLLDIKQFMITNNADYRIDHLDAGHRERYLASQAHSYAKAMAQARQLAQKEFEDKLSPIGAGGSVGGGRALSPTVSLNPALTSDAGIESGRAFRRHQLSLSPSPSRRDEAHTSTKTRPEGLHSRSSNLVQTKTSVPKSKKLTIPDPSVVSTTTPAAAGHKVLISAADSLEVSKKSEERNTTSARSSTASASTSALHSKRLSNNTGSRGAARRIVYSDVLQGATALPHQQQKQRNQAETQQLVPAQSITERNVQFEIASRERTNFPPAVAGPKHMSNQGRRLSVDVTNIAAELLDVSDAPESIVIRPGSMGTSSITRKRYIREDREGKQQTYTDIIYSEPPRFDCTLPLFVQQGYEQEELYDFQHQSYSPTVPNGMIVIDKGKGKAVPPVTSPNFDFEDAEFQESQGSSNKRSAFQVGTEDRSHDRGVDHMRTAPCDRRVSVQGARASNVTSSTHRREEASCGQRKLSFDHESDRCDDSGSDERDRIRSKAKGSSSCRRKYTREKHRRAAAAAASSSTKTPPAAAATIHTLNKKAGPSSHTHVHSNKTDRACISVEDCAGLPLPWFSPASSSVSSSIVSTSSWPCSSSSLSLSNCIICNNAVNNNGSDTLGCGQNHWTNNGQPLSEMDYYDAPGQVSRRFSSVGLGIEDSTMVRYSHNDHDQPSILITLKPKRKKITDRLWSKIRNIKRSFFSRAKPRDRTTNTLSLSSDRRRERTLEFLDQQVEDQEEDKVDQHCRQLQQQENLPHLQSPKKIDPTVACLNHNQEKVSLISASDSVHKKALPPASFRTLELQLSSASVSMYTAAETAIVQSARMPSLLMVMDSISWPSLLDELSNTSLEVSTEAAVAQHQRHHTKEQAEALLQELGGSETVLGSPDSASDHQLSGTDSTTAEPNHLPVSFSYSTSLPFSNEAILSTTQSLRISSPSSPLSRCSPQAEQVSPPVLINGLTSEELINSIRFEFDQEGSPGYYGPREYERDQERKRLAQMTKKWAKEQEQRQQASNGSISTEKSKGSMLFSSSLSRSLPSLPRSLSSKSLFRSESSNGGDGGCGSVDSSDRMREDTRNETVMSVAEEETQCFTKDRSASVGSLTMMSTSGALLLETVFGIASTVWTRAIATLSSAIHPPVVTEDNASLAPRLQKMSVGDLPRT